jgi:glycosyltransferase involved in cell wall biosynthesis
MTRPRRVLVAGTQVPFTRGGAEWHLAALHSQLVARGFCAETVQLPFQWDPRAEAVRSALAWRLLDLQRAGGEPVDLLIATRFPSYVARHPNKIVWLFHQFRQAYDLHDAGIDGFPDTPEGRELRERIVALDTQALKECRRIFTTSLNNARRLERYNGLKAEVLRLPLLDPGGWRGEASEGYVLSVGRLDALKRTELLVRAAAQLPASARILIAGEGPLAPPLERLARELGVEARVRFLGYVDDASVRDLYARAAAVCYTPYDEDYGLVSLEAFHSRKPVVTTTDAGGPLEFVRDGETGLVVAPEPLAIGDALARLLSDPVGARAMGERGYQEVRHLNWDAVIESLTQSPGHAGKLG